MTATDLGVCYEPSQHAPGWMARAVATVREWRQRAKGRSELGRLDDRMLRDIGLSRAEADYLSHIPFWRE
jgi:uncharacterized protein YjiS (DUF1127 family)